MNRLATVFVRHTRLWWFACSCGYRIEPDRYAGMRYKRKRHLAHHISRREKVDRG
jgi:hypothetical protein